MSRISRTLCLVDRFGCSRFSLHHRTTVSAGDGRTSLFFVSINNMIIILVVIMAAMIAVTDAFICDQKCQCIVSSGKFTANCTGQEITRLPQCHNYDSEKQAKLKRIQILMLSRNNFYKLENFMFNDACLNNLQKIYLQQVGLADVDDQAFHPLTNVIELSMAENYLRHVPTKALEGLTRLQTLDLSYNRITEIGNHSFRYLVGLRKISLNNNNISHLDTDAFAGLNNLETIDLASNHLSILRPEAFSFLRNLHSLYLESNPWSCNCRMQPFKRMLLLRSRIQIHDRPKCAATSVVWNRLGLDHFQCAPKIFKNYSETDITVPEGSTMRLKCAIHVETFGDDLIDQEYLSYSKIHWYWNNNVLITNDSKGCDHNCNNNHQQSFLQHFRIDETIEEYNPNIKLKVSTLSLFSIMTVNQGSYRCSVVNQAGSDELFFHVDVVAYFRGASFSATAGGGGGGGHGFYDHTKIIHPAAASARDPQVSYKTNVGNANDNGENGDHVLFGLVLGILTGLFLVLVIFSIMFVFFVRKQPKIGRSMSPMVVNHHHNGGSLNHHHELAMIGHDASSSITTADQHTLDDNRDETGTETTERNLSQNEFNPLLMAANPVKKPPRLGIPDVSSIYSSPSWTMNRANLHLHHHHHNTLNNHINRSRYASYAETEPIYSEGYYTTIKRPLGRLAVPRTVIEDGPSGGAGTFISDTASEV